MRRLRPNLPGGLRNVLSAVMHILLRLLDLVLIPLTALMAFWFKSSRKRNFSSSPVTQKILMKAGVFPIIDYYHEPLFNPKYLRKSLREERYLPAIDFNRDEQIRLLKRFSYNEELLSFPRQKTGNELDFSYDYGAYPSGDSELLYSMIRTFRPRRMIEIGCGSSTLMAMNAIRRNREDDAEYRCEYTCIEPYEQPWLEKTGLNVVRKKVEEVPLDLFRTLEKNDILFIDSSHVIRPQGDVLYEILEILPTVNPGVLIHFHDICTPRDYFDEWVPERFWNEQYLLEAFLSCNRDFEIILASNDLLHTDYDLFVSKCPVFKMDKEENPKRETGSFWIRKRNVEK